MIIEVHSDDHIPAHVHIMDLNKRQLCKLIITKDRPITEKDLRYLRSDKYGELSPTYKARIVLWASEKNDN